MTAKKAFIILLRMVFVFSSLQFISDAFYKWDGYSYYMRFMDFVPDLSLTYIFAALCSLIFALALWLGIYIFIKVTPKLLNVRFEHALTWIILCVLLLAAKKILLKGVSLTNLFGLNYFVIIMIGGILVASIVWLLRRYNEKILNGLNNRITPLVWLFIALLVLALPFSFLKKRSYDTTTDLSERVNAQEPDEIASGKKRPNIILVIMDSLTAHDMQLYGYHRPTTPFISKWAKNSVVFSRTYSSSNWTTPSMMSMMSSQRPWTHEVWYRAFYNPASIKKHNLAEVLKSNGYAVYGFVQNHYAHPEVLGIQDSFLIKDKSHSFLLSPRTLNGKIRRLFIDRPVVAEWVMDVQPIFRAIIKAFRIPLSSTPFPPELVYDRFFQYLTNQNQGDKSTDSPFFALLHVYAPHTWYLPPKPYLGKFGDDSKFITDIQQEKITNRKYPPDMQPQIDQLRNRYDEFILYSDNKFESFIEELTKSVDMSNTIVILTSDHGESFSHGYQEHDGPFLYDQLVHVPLIINLPWEKKSKTINMPVDQTDIAPTILALANIQVPTWMEGRSMTPLINGEKLESRPVFSMQLIKNRSFGYPITKGAIAVWDGDYKLIYHIEDKKSLLFNLRSDPNETLNLSYGNAGIKQSLMKLIDDNLYNANIKITQSAGK